MPTGGLIAGIGDFGVVDLINQATQDATAEAQSFADEANAAAQTVGNVVNRELQILPVKAGQAMSIGTPVYVSGADGTNIVVSPASNASEATSSKVLGLLMQTLANNGQGSVVTQGKLVGLNTSTSTLGNPVWLGVSGALIYGLTNKPVAPAHLVYLGVVSRVHATLGEIIVHIQDGVEFNEIHDYLETSKQDKDTIQYDALLGVWKNIHHVEGQAFASYSSVPAGLIDEKGNSLYTFSEEFGLAIHGFLLACAKGEFAIQDENGFEALKVLKNGMLRLLGLELASENGKIQIIDKNKYPALTINKDGTVELILSNEFFLKNYNRAFPKNDYLANTPDYVFDIEAGSRQGREYATSIYPESVVGEHVKVSFSGARKKILKSEKFTWDDTQLQSAVQSKSFAVEVGSEAHLSKNFAINILKANRKNAQNKSIKVLAIGDSLTEAHCFYPDGSKSGWSWISCLKELSMKDNIDIGNINILPVGTKNNEGGTLNYAGQTQTVRSFAEGRSGWSMYGYANYPLYVRVDGAATPADSQNFMGYKGMYYLCGFATKTPNYEGSTGQTWVDCPTILHEDDALNFQTVLTEICGTPVGRYKPDYCSVLWEALKVYTDFGGAGSYNSSTSDPYMENYLLNATTGKLIKPDNPFYSYDKAKEWNNGNPVNNVAFSISTYLSRYKTLADDGSTRLAVGSTAGTQVTNNNAYDVCTPTHIIIGLGTNDQWLSPANSVTIGMRLLNACKFNSSVKIGWWIKRFCGVLDSTKWIDKGVLKEGISQRYFNINKEYQTALGSANISNQLTYIPAYYTHCITAPVFSAENEDADSKFQQKLTIASQDSIHCDVYGHYTIGHQVLAWLYWTLQ